MHKNKSIKLIKYYSFINYNLIYNNKAINRYKKDNFGITEDISKNLELLKKSIVNYYLNGCLQLHGILVVQLTSMFLIVKKT